MTDSQSGTITRTYDRLGRLTQETTTAGNDQLHMTLAGQSAHTHTTTPTDLRPSPRAATP